MKSLKWWLGCLATIISLLSPVYSHGQMFGTNTGVTSFSASTPLETIEAENKKGQVLLNSATGDIAIRMNMRDFVFPNKLMQEHFNENYIESAKFPTATFSGKVSGVPDFGKDGTYDVLAVGKFTVHGVSKDRTFKGKLTVAGKTVTITSDFQVALTDHKIEVPQIVFVKIAQVISVKTQYTLVQK